MAVGIEKFESFFNYNLEIKKILHKLVPTDEKGYDKEYIIKYNEQLYNALEMIEYYLVRTLTNFGLDSYIEFVSQKFKGYKKKINGCYDFAKLSATYNFYFADMNQDYINEINNEIKGHTLWSTFDLFKNSQTINEMLHFIHHYITNNERLYSQLPKIAEKVNIGGQPITLCGRENKYAKELFEHFPLQMSCGITDIVSVADNKVIMMVRDKGHALSIEVDVFDDMCLVNYYIPKICNFNMVNELKGVNPVNSKSKFTTGQFHTTKETLAQDIYSFIDKVPDDSHMYIEGGSNYEIGRSY